MKLKKITLREPVERLAVSVKKSTADLVEAYRQEYKAAHGVEIETSALVETILKEFITSDKDFMKKYEASKAGA
ncbi:MULTISPECIES: DUF2274 domain-containing protein [unclassified Variovorax]|uniref:DUF2274 domain-containing protein n=1 Tax=unclassified Variovorax TaxID=663243 RepID=UPI00076C51A0|nr:MULTISPECIES: DUF2274 domain-containing protein [unclassified Variovorax]KWT86108.1 hypothetical protein APY03_3812 [Variovorax sp. WDL1]PNG50097.1 hypothetical protein CHC06_05720 [Variovorax sp. B2]PNG50969.1 hypothetical protein CHC07_05625 [Variovorax sp. B4]VTU41805.1 hypothetical protein SRS16P1_00133 [Variovorax sp. SRS16]VTU41844.1 hypothetical protein E5P1_00133 [Variovorax sp. PBL-E5]